jgi:hypothetical protein
MFAAIAGHQLLDWGGKPLVWLVVLAGVLMVVSRLTRRP